jgi:hypothetical protein
MAKAKKTSRGVIDAAARAAVDLQACGARFALIGGLAIGARAEPRFTRDVDIALAVARDEDAEQLVNALTRRGYRVETVIEQTRAGRLATVRLVHPSMPGVFTDLLFASSGIEHELVAAAEPLSYRRGTRLPVATVGHLIALKVLSESEARLQDRIDLRTLASVATPDDWGSAEAALRLIRARGFHRGRALLSSLRRWRRVLVKA